MTQNNAIQSIGRDNSTIIDALMKAKNVAVMLGRQGFKVLDISINSRNPRIIINPSPRCRILDGASIKITRLSKIAVKTMAANIDGVQIEWMVPRE